MSTYFGEPTSETDRETAWELLRRAVLRSPLGRLRPALASTPALETAVAVLLAVSTYLAARPALRAYQVAGGSVLVAAAAGGSVLLAFVGARLLHLRPVPSYGLSLAGLLLTILLADGPHAGPIATALVRGPNRLLTETLPLSGGRAIISALVVLVWLCGAAAGEILARAGGRGRGAPFALAIPALLFLVCYAVASSAPGDDRFAGPALLVLLSVAAALRNQVVTSVGEEADPDVRPSVRYRAAVTGIVVSAAVAAILAGTAPSVLALSGRPADLHRRPPTVVPVITDPLGSMAQLRDQGARALPTPELTATLSGPSTGYLAMADLDVYDGGQWRFAATFQPTGGRVPAAAPATSLLDNRVVTQHVDITGSLPLALLPALDRPLDITGLDAVADPVTGMLLPQSRSARPSYTVLSETPGAALPGLPPADGVNLSAGTAADTQLPPNTTGDLVTTLRFLSTLDGGQRPAATVAYLQTVLQTLQNGEKRVDPSLAAAAPAGASSAPHPTTTTTVPREASNGTSLSEVINAVTVYRAATPEQFATFYAMIARYLGVPARVVSGFRLAGGSTGRAVPPGTYQVTSRQAWAWVEIPVEGLGWVVCDPTPDATTGVVTTPPESVSAPATTVPPRQASAVPRSSGAGGHPLAPPGHIKVPHLSHVPPWVYALAAIAGLLVVAGLGGPGQAAARRWLRRRRRRSADPGVLAVGAWLELLDGLDRAGMRPVPGATATEVAQEVGHHFGAELVPRAAAVAATADRAVFSTTSPVAPDAALEAWQDAQDVCRRVLGGLDTRQRLRSSILVGSAPSRPSGSRR